MDSIEKTLKSVFGLSYLMPSQETVITRIIENGEKKEDSTSITILPTGAGKSLCFMLPAVLFKNRYTILLYPLLSLMNDQAKRLEKNSIPFSLIKGGMEGREKYKELNKLRTFNASILITNMESLIILTERGDIDFMINKTELFVIDEAHTAVTWAETFRPSYLELNRITEYLRPHQRLCFTATADDEILKKLKENVLKSESVEILRLSADRSNIHYATRRSLNRKEDILDIITPPERRPAIIFCSYRSECLEYSEKLKDYFPSFYYHAGLEKGEKERIEREFYKSTDGVLSATIAYGMGVDKKDIRTVIHLHAPEDAASFLQEAGRGGRDGKEMLSLVLYSDSDKGSLKYIFKGDKCIRSELLELMGEGKAHGCTSCSKCLKEDERAKGEKEIISLIRHFPLLFSLKCAAKILKLRSLKSWSLSEITNALNTLVKEKRIKRVFNRLYATKEKRG